MDPTDILDELCAIFDCPRDAEVLLTAARRAAAAKKRLAQHDRCSRWGTKDMIALK